MSQIQSIIYDMSNAEYHSRSELSKSDLDLLLKSPRHYSYAKANKKEPTPDMVLGSLFHTLVLQPELLEVEYAIEPEKKLKKDIGSEAYEIYKKELEEFEKTTKTIITQKQLQTATLMKESLFSHKTASKLLKDVIIESSAFWIDDDTGIPCRCRPDAAWHDMVLVDLKSSSDGSRNGFRRAVVDHNYDLQSYHYLNGYSKATGKTYKAMVFIVVEKTPPYNVAVYTLDADSVNTGAQLQRKALKIYQDWRSGAIDEGYLDDVQTLSIGPYAQNIDNR